MKLFLWMNEMQLMTANQQYTMTSLEMVEFINADRAERRASSHEAAADRLNADLRHADFLIKCTEVLGGGVREFADTYVHPQNGQTYPMYRFPKREACLMAMSYSYELQAKVFDRMTELEAKQPAPRELTRMELLQIAMDAEKEKLEALALANHAIATKAEIGHRREATAMNTASQAVKKANALEIELDKSKQYSSIKRMEMLHHGVKFDWRKLKSTGMEMGIDTIDIFDANYGTVKAYHADVWKETYALDIA